MGWGSCGRLLIASNGPDLGNVRLGELVEVAVDPREGRLERRSSVDHIAVRAHAHGLLDGGIPTRLVFGGVEGNVECSSLDFGCLLGFRPKLIGRLLRGHGVQCRSRDTRDVIFGDVDNNLRGWVGKLK